MRIDYQQVEETIRAGYRRVTTQYRMDDEIEVTTENHRRLCGVLKRLCRSYDYPITVLDVGCGTGRYFHCLENTDRLIGLDISEEMLHAARNPVRASEISVSRIELKRGNAYMFEFPQNTFDFIYSLGMFGHGCPVTRQVCEKFYSWLKPGGTVLFDTVDFAGLPMCYKIRRRTRAFIYPVLPRRFKKRLDDREAKSPFFGMTAFQLRGILRATQFKHFTIESHVCKSPLWSGRHLECIGLKG